MEIKQVIGTYKESDIEANERLSRCKHCGGDIFYLSIFDEARKWWHESLEADFEHRAEPLEVAD